MFSLFFWPATKQPKKHSEHKYPHLLQFFMSTGKRSTTDETKSNFSIDLKRIPLPPSQIPRCCRKSTSNIFLSQGLACGIRFLPSKSFDAFTLMLSAGEIMKDKIFLETKHFVVKQTRRRCVDQSNLSLYLPSLFQIKNRYQYIGELLTIILSFQV